MRKSIPRRTTKASRSVTRKCDRSTSPDADSAQISTTPSGLGNREIVNARCLSQGCVARKLLPFLLPPVGSPGVGLPHWGASVVRRAVSEFANAGDLWENQRPARRNDKGGESRLRSELPSASMVARDSWYGPGARSTVLNPNCRPTIGPHLNATHIEAGQERINNQVPPPGKDSHGPAAKARWTVVSTRHARSSYWPCNV